MSNLFKLFKLRKEERWLAAVALVVFTFFNVLLMASHWKLCTQSASGGFYSLFTRWFNMSGYDCWSWIMVSGKQVYFVTDRHPLYLSFLYPMYLLNHWIMDITGINCAVFMVSVVVIFSALYTVIFIYRTLNEVLMLTQGESLLLVSLLFSFAHVLLPTMVPDHFVISMMLLSMTLYMAGKKIKAGICMKAWESGLLLFLTSGIALSNGIKTMLADWFVNGRRVFRFKFIVVGILLPLAALFCIQRVQYEIFEVPQQEALDKMLAEKARKFPDKVKKEKAEQAKHKVWIERNGMKQMGADGIWNLIDFDTPRWPALIENLLGESFQLHENHLLEDVHETRPKFVNYRYAYKYGIEIVIVLLFLAGVVCSIRYKFFLLLLSWMGIDMMLNIVLGFGINEVYIMTSGWAFIIPVALGYLLRRSKQWSTKVYATMMGIIFLLSCYLWVSNGMLIVKYLTTIA